MAPASSSQQPETRRRISFSSMLRVNGVIASLASPKRDVDLSISEHDSPFPKIYDISFPEVLDRIFSHVCLFFFRALRRLMGPRDQLSTKDLSHVLLVNRQWYYSARRRLYANLHITGLNGQRWSMSVVNDTKKQTFLQTHLTGITINRNTSVLLSLLPTIAPRLSSLTLLSTASFPIGLLSTVLPCLDNLNTLCLLAQDLRPAPRPRFARGSQQPEGTIKSGTDLALIALGKARMEKKLSGLTQVFLFRYAIQDAQCRDDSALRIAGSPDVTEEGILGYLAPGADDDTDLSLYESPTGASLRSLELACCHALGANALRIVADLCPNLTSLSLKEVDVEEQIPEDANANQTGFAGLPYLLNRLQKLRSLSLADLATFRPLRTFATMAGEAGGFEGVNPSPLLTELTLSNVIDFNTEDLLLFPTIHALTIRGCPFVDCIPVGEKGLEQLRFLSYLSPTKRGLSLHNLWDLCTLGSGEARDPQLGKKGLRKLIVDTTKLAFPHWSLGATTPSSKTYYRYMGRIPPPASFEPYLDSPILVPAVPSSLVMQALLRSEELEMAALFGFDSTTHARLAPYEISSLLAQSKSLVNVQAS